MLTGICKYRFGKKGIQTQFPNSSSQLRNEVVQVMVHLLHFQRARSLTSVSQNFDHDPSYRLGVECWPSFREAPGLIPTAV